MSNISGLKKLLILFTVLFIPSLAYLLLISGKNKFNRLPILGVSTISPQGDTIYHTVPPFALVNQDGESVTEKDFEGKIMVADFFFSTCETICPKMTGQLYRVQEKFKAQRELRLVSFTVDPKHDTPEVLRDYARKNLANAPKWTFLTGDQQQIYELGVKGFLLPAQEDALAPGGFLHSEMLVLVDKEKRIRGFYDGTNPSAVDTLMGEIMVLLQEYQN